MVTVLKNLTKRIKFMLTNELYWMNNVIKSKWQKCGVCVCQAASIMSDSLGLYEQ